MSSGAEAFGLTGYCRDPSLLSSGDLPWSALGGDLNRVDWHLHGENYKYETSLKGQGL
jgi:hypothetical protein